MGLENAGLLFLPTTLAPADSPFLKPSWAGNRTAKEPPRGGGHGAGRAGFARSPLPISNRFPRRFAARLKQPREKEGGNLFLGWLLRFSLAEGQEVPLAADRGEEEQLEWKSPARIRDTRRGNRRGRPEVQTRWLQEASARLAWDSPKQVQSGSRRGAVQRRGIQRERWNNISEQRDKEQHGPSRCRAERKISNRSRRNNFHPNIIFFKCGNEIKDWRVAASLLLTTCEVG
ncbi:uncharacterized protein LOC117052950 isoform X1 [Lacerta agilis]|uniref:uncharacterized protein LOC117052950 isoform X1 n=1 Tax=Lacerta agilis TaxID=80427 RepID=UPI001419A810|nr:uncharacterized protein LOC117052950 isoform X1 [Lacerta agilis]